MDFVLEPSELELAFALVDDVRETAMLVEQQPTVPICECRWW